MLIPGQGLIFPASEQAPRLVLLLVGYPGSGKAAYCMQFLKDGFAEKEHCLYVSCSPSLREDRFRSQFYPLAAVPDFVTVKGDGSDVGGLEALSLLERSVADWTSGTDGSRVVLDSITDLLARFPADSVLRFVARLYDLLKERKASAIFAMSGSLSAPPADAIGALVDGVLQVKMDDSSEELRRSIRLLSLKAGHVTPKWASFEIRPDGGVEFIAKGREREHELTCKLCNGPIMGMAKTEVDSQFHPHCLDTYRKLGDIYGAHILYALQPGVVNANFFFVDIVGLSNPLLSIERQIAKIQDLNVLIGSCHYYAAAGRENKVVLPTGDGMAVGFLLSPESPLQLSVELHGKLRAFNTKSSPEARLGVRIGLSSGPVFVVADINNNQNVWGPGIILARRVMDLGDEGHILLADNIAEQLINLKDEYRKIILPISKEYRIKHGQALKVYSAYSTDFGNPSIPSRMS